ncbi:MAG: cytochrome c maturation protein CcmE [Rhodospirillaceae bacterium]|nr:cytochrome c maturation protein CcmE [Rhodospirillaceae bacterium]
MTRKRRRLYFVMLALLGLGAGTALVLTAFQDNIVFFFSPTEIASQQLTPERRIRVGGLVEQGSVVKNGENVTFAITDMNKSLKIQYQGLLPDLFREGQGIVAEGRMGTDGVFTAHEVLAKHDENYMPREVADALKKSGQWHEPTAKNGAPTTTTEPVPTTAQ